MLKLDLHTNEMSLNQFITLSVDSTKTGLQLTKNAESQTHTTASGKHGGKENKETQNAHAQRESLRRLAGDFATSILPENLP